MSQNSCLVQKLSHYVPLNPRSRDNITRLERDERDYGKGTEIHREGQRNANLYVVKHGWLYSYTDMKDGRRQIVEIHHPGDIVGFSDIAFDTCTTVLRAAEDVRLCPFPKKDLDDVFRDAPQLAALLFALAVRNQVILIDFLQAIGRMSARERIAYLLLDLMARLRITNKSMKTVFRLPLNQTEISDVLGLTNVYVSRSFMALQKDGLIRRDNGTVEVLEEEKLVQLCDFVDRHSRVDTSWFPAG
nr:Crp/Fnr family transcriptional regulator [Marinicella sp. W31]MDC2879345.1 Crp/Fnr family transcriptional regulator [Marinicella sp. W31]